MLEVVIGDITYGVRLEEVREIIPMPSHLNYLPSSPSWVMGITKVRDQIFAVLDYQKMQSKEETKNPTMIILIDSPKKIGICVSSIKGINKDLTNVLDLKSLA
jgi:chemotaxis signal transduction protein